jgi:uncharacterized protein (DUF433 family)
MSTLRTDLDRIVVSPETLGGAPHVRGTRISVCRALEVIAQYRDRGELERDYPGLDDESIRQVLLFAARIVEGEIVPLDRSAA